MMSGFCGVCVSVKAAAHNGFFFLISWLLVCLLWRNSCSQRTLISINSDVCMRRTHTYTHTLHFSSHHSNQWPLTSPAAVAVFSSLDGACSCELWFDARSVFSACLRLRFHVTHTHTRTLFTSGKNARCKIRMNNTVHLIIMWLICHLSIL